MGAKRPGCVYRWVDGWGWGLFSRSGKAHKHKPPRLSRFDKEAAATASEGLDFWHVSARESIESEFFGGFKPSGRGTFPFRYRQTSPGWVAQRPRTPPYLIQQAREAAGGLRVTEMAIANKTVCVMTTEQP